MSWLNEISNFLEDYSDLPSNYPDIDIYKDMGIAGDDFHEMIDKYSEQYDIDLSDYLWYFHTNEEGISFGEYFFKPPNKRVERIPVTPKMLADFIKTKKWEVNYPTHEIPKKRLDLKINLIILIISVIIIFTWILNKAT